MLLINKALSLYTRPEISGIHSVPNTTDYCEDGCKIRRRVNKVLLTWGINEGGETSTEEKKIQCVCWEKQ